MLWNDLKLLVLSGNYFPGWLMLICIGTKFFFTVTKKVLSFRHAIPAAYEVKIVFRI